MDFAGVFVALITPFDRFGRIEEKRFEDLIERQIEGGVDGIICSGTTGEHSTLSEKECTRLAEITVEKVEKRVSVLVGTGSSSTQKSVEKAREAKDLGADGCFVIMPYCNRPNALGCFAHYQAIAEVDFPIMPYYHPGRTGVTLTPKDLAKICQIPQVKAIKDCSGDLKFFFELRSLTDKPLLMGDDDLLIPSLKLGGKGSVSVMANLFPREWKEIVSLGLKNQFHQAEALFTRYQSLIRALFLETNPQGIKYAMSLQGLCEPILRLPLMLPSEKTREAIEQELKVFALETV